MYPQCLETTAHTLLHSQKLGPAWLHFLPGVSQAAVQVLVRAGFSFGGSAGGSRIYFPACGVVGPTQSLQLLCNTENFSFCWLLVRGCPQHLEATHASLLCEFPQCGCEQSLPAQPTWELRRGSGSGEGHWARRGNAEGS